MFLVVAEGSDGDRHAHRSVARGIPGAGSSRYDLPDADRDGLVLDPALQGVHDGAMPAAATGTLASCDPEPVRHAIAHW